MQTNFSSEVVRWLSAFEECGSKYKTVEIIPFSDSLPDVDTEGPTIARGTTTMIKNAHKKGWGLFFNEENFRPSLWQKKYDKYLFNHDGEVYRIKDLHTFKGDDCFLRPNSDMKDFSGSRIDRAGLVKFYNEVMAGEFPFNGDTEVFLAPLKDIYKEYRIFIVNGEPVAWSQYRLRSMLAKKAEVPMDIIKFARLMAKQWSPEKAYVMDICTDNEEMPYVLELNCFNASGVYLADVLNIVKAVEGLYE
jgi:hypothetical protein